MNRPKPDYAEAKGRATLIQCRLRANDKRLGGSVLVWHRDGSIFLFDHAFVVTYGDFFLVLTEHHSTQVYDKSDVTHLRALGPRLHIRTVR